MAPSLTCGGLAASLAAVGPLNSGRARAAHLAGEATRLPSKPHDAWRAQISSHETFTHDSIDSLGYDWERIANPTIAPRFPLRVYLPRTTDEVIGVVLEARSRGDDLRIRGKGHSSNDLVVTEGGSVLLTEHMTSVIEVDEEELTATVQPGLANAALDELLAPKGYGLPVIGDHKDVTVGGFASAGGISPASHRFGLFVDNVERLEYVDWDGQLHQCSRSRQPEDFHAVLAGLGRHGVLVTVTARIIPIDKYGTILRNDQAHYFDRDGFVEASERRLAEPGDALMQRGMWADLGLVRGRRVALGQFSSYHETAQTPQARLADRLSYDLLHGIGFMAGRLPRALDRPLKQVGLAGVLFSPRFASIKNVEFFSDKILDATVGDPTRMLIALVPLDRYREVFAGLWDLVAGHRERHHCFKVITAYVKGIRSSYLAQGGADDRFCELTFYVGIDLERMTDDLLEQIVSEFDDLCIEHGAFRYMHTKTVKDPERRRRIDPNAFYSGRASEPA